MVGISADTFDEKNRRPRDIVLFYKPRMDPQEFINSCLPYLREEGDKKTVVRAVKNFGDKYPIIVTIMPGKTRGGYLRGGAVQIDGEEYGRIQMEEEIKKRGVINDMTGLCLEFGIEHDDFYKSLGKIPYKELLLVKENFESNLKSCVRNICQSGQAPFTTLKVEPTVKGPGLLVLPLEIKEPTDPVLSQARDLLYRELFSKL